MKEWKEYYKTIGLDIKQDDIEEDGSCSDSDCSNGSDVTAEEDEAPNEKGLAG